MIASGRISAIGNGASLQIPANAKRINLIGYSAIPGLVGMHDHLFYLGTDGELAHDMPFGYPRLYLANGVTTIRTTGPGNRASRGFGKLIGPRMHVTGP